MALQTQNLVMVGLGIQGHTPAHLEQPQLVDGVHLRWGFQRAIGFPWHGFHLLRRLHIDGDSVCLSSHTTTLQKGPLPHTEFSTPDGVVSSDQNFFLTDEFPPPSRGGGDVEFSLDGRQYLRFTLPPGVLARRVEVRIGFRQDGEVLVTAYSGNSPSWAAEMVPVVQSEVSGRASEVKSTTLEFDAISGVHIGSGPAVLVELCYLQVAEEATTNWEPVPRFPAPMCLPVTHPDYPCTLGQSENLSDARHVAKNRIHYGDPDDFTARSPPAYDRGMVSIETGSAIVTGSGTDWRDNLSGMVVQVDGDSTAYAIAQVLEPHKLVLTRHYGGNSNPAAAYEIRDDAFAQLHDSLLHLVTGGSGVGPMAHRSLPMPVYNTGTIEVTRGSAIVTGAGTNWRSELTGLAFQVVGATSGSVTVNNGSPDVTGIGTNWSPELVGFGFRVLGEENVYTIASIDPSAQRLTLNEDYTGTSDPGKRYIVYDQTRYTILDVNLRTRLTLERDYLGATVQAPGTPYQIVSRLQAPEPGGVAPLMPRQYPLDLILLTALHPALAQMVGLYWVDQTANPNDAYDYLIVADYAGVLSGLAPADIPARLGQIGFSQLEAFIIFNRKIASASPPTAPGGLMAHELPPGIVPDSRSPNDRNSVGLRWNLQLTEKGTLLPDKSVMYHLWRDNLGSGDRPGSPGRHELVTKDGPLLVTKPRLPPGVQPQRPPDWPSEPFHAIDSGLPDAWYSYQVSGIDIFGQHTSNSEPAIVRLLDTFPPPPPTGLEAYALDPQDRTVLKDAAFDDWWSALTSASWYQALPDADKKNLIGLRVRWQWTHMHMRQAPDTHEFRIYYQPDQLNALLGNTGQVTAVSDTQSTVVTDIPNNHGTDAYAGAWLRIRSDAFQVRGSDAGGPLRLRAANIGPNDDVRPSPNTPCTVVIPAVLPSDPTTPTPQPPFVDYTESTNWDQRYFVVGYDEHVTEKAPARKDPNEQDLSGDAATVVGAVVTLDGNPDLSDTGLLGEPLFLANDTARTDKTYLIRAVDDTNHTVTVDGAPRIGNAPSPWTIGRPVREYEVFLPLPDGAFDRGLPLSPSINKPVVYAQIGVSAADNKAHTADDPRWLEPVRGGFGDRTGNESSVGGPATIFRVQRDPPLRPDVPIFDSDPVFATPADYHSRSFYTFRWVKAEGLKTHVFRALDDALFQADWSWRKARLANQDPFVVSASDPEYLMQYFPEELRPDPLSPDNDVRTTRRNTLVEKINALNDISTTARMAEVRAEYQRLMKDENDALRVLAGLPGNERAFTQLTIQPLDPEEPDPEDPTKLRWRNRRGPDDPDDFQMPDPSNPLAERLRVVIDTLDGRSTSRYFYRAAYVDGAQNRSAELSLSTPPVYLPNVVPPRTPVIAKVLGGDRQITLRWASNREPDLAEYRVYRADSKEAARDLRLMTLLHTEPAPAGDPVARPAEIIWTDHPVLGLKMYHYRLVAVDETGNVSSPSLTIMGRAFDDSPPELPELTVTWVHHPGHTRAQITWTTQDESLLQRREDGGLWVDLTRWRAPGQHVVRDPFSDPSRNYEYRLRVRKYTGTIAKIAPVALNAQ